MHRSPDLARAAMVFLVVLALYFVGYSRLLPPAADEMLYFAVTESIVKSHSVTVDQASSVFSYAEEFGVGDHRYSKKGPLTSLLAVPLYLLAQRLPIGAVDTVLLLNYLVTALIVALLYLLVRRLGYTQAVALALATITAFGSPLWVYAKSFFAESTITLCIIAGVYAAHAAATTRRRRWLVLAGVTFGAGIAAKNINVLLLLPVPVYLGWVFAGDGTAPTPRPGDSPEASAPDPPAGQARTFARPTEYRAAAPRLLRAGVWFGLGLAPILVLLMLYSYVRYGTPFSTGYGDWETFSTPVWEGVAGILFSPGKSILVYTPLFLLLPFWTPDFVRRFRGFGALLLSIVALHLALYGSWFVWWGAWGWASRFTVPILPLLALLLADGLSRLRRPVVKGLVLVLGALSVAVQVLGVAVHHSVYLSELMSIDLRPDLLTLWDLSRSPILHQLRFMSRQDLDLAWVQRAGPDVVNVPGLAIALAGACVALVGLAVLWRSTRRLHWLGALAASTLVVVGVVYQDLRIYYREGDPSMMRVGDALEEAPPDAAVLHMIPLTVVPYSNWQKRPLPELGWVEEPEPKSRILTRLEDVIRRSSELWVVTDTAEPGRSNGVESTLTRSLIRIGQEKIGRFRLLRYATSSANLPLVRTAHRFADGILLTGYLGGAAPVTPGGTLDLVLEWRADETAAARPDYTVFVHVVAADGTRIAQHDSQPADEVVPVSSWMPGQVIYDHHQIAMPPGALARAHRVLVGLYQLADGKRVPVLDGKGKAGADHVTLDLN